MRCKKEKRVYLAITINLLLACCLFSISCTETNLKNAATEFGDIMKSDVLIEEAIQESWNLLNIGQQLADEGKSIDYIVKCFPEGTIFKTNNTSILFFIKGSFPMIIELVKSAKKTKTKGGSAYERMPLDIQESSLSSLSKNKLLSSFTKNDGLVDVIGSDKGDNERQKKKALILAPYNEYFGKYDDANIAYEYLKRNRNYKDHVNFRKDNFTLNDYLSFAEYDLVHLSTHGKVFCNPAKHIKNGVVEIINGEESNYCTTLISTKIKHGIKYKGDKAAFKQKILKKYGTHFDNHIAWNGEHLFLKGTFFDNAYKDLENKIWIFSACEVGVRSDLSESMKSIHTNSHFFSWLYAVNSDDAFKAFHKFYENLITKGLDAVKAFELIPIPLKENLKSHFPKDLMDTLGFTETMVFTEAEVEESPAIGFPDEIPDDSFDGSLDDLPIINDDPPPTTTSLLHLQTDDPRHGIEVIDMLNLENENLLQYGELYPLVGEFDDGIDETLNLKVKLIGYTKEEFLEKQMSISLEVDDELVLIKRAFLPDVPRDNCTVESLKDHEYGVIITITDIGIPDVGTKEQITLKASLHLNDKHISIHKETVSIVTYGIIATTKERGRKSKFTYDGKRKTGKFEVAKQPALYYDNEGYTYSQSKGNGWIKFNMRKMTGSDTNFDSKTNTLLNFPLVGQALISKMSDFEKSKKITKREVDCDFPVKCTAYSSPDGTFTFDPSGKLIELKTRKLTVNYTYGNYDVILPEAEIPAKVKELEKGMGNFNLKSLFKKN